ncbi:unnamed protein product, partial [Mesorhabditis spiculigera]
MNFAGAEFYDTHLADELPIPGFFLAQFKKKRKETPKTPEIWICTAHQKPSWFGISESNTTGVPEPTKVEMIITMNDVCYPETKTVPVARGGQRMYLQNVNLMDTCRLCGRVGVPWITAANEASGRALAAFSNDAAPVVEGVRMCRIHFPQGILKGDINVNFRQISTNENGRFSRVTIDCVYCAHCFSVCDPRAAKHIMTEDELPRTVSDDVRQSPPGSYYVCLRHYAPGVIQEKCTYCSAAYAPECRIQLELVRQAVSRFLGQEVPPRFRLCAHHIPERFLINKGSYSIITCVDCDYCEQLVSMFDTYGGFVPEFLEKPFPPRFEIRCSQKRFQEVRICRKHYISHDGAKSSHAQLQAVLGALQKKVRAEGWEPVDLLKEVNDPEGCDTSIYMPGSSYYDAGFGANAAKPEDAQRRTRKHSPPPAEVTKRGRLDGYE